VTTTEIPITESAAEQREGKSEQPHATAEPTNGMFVSRLVIERNDRSDTFPDTFYLTTLQYSGLRLLEAVPLSARREGEHVVIVWDDLDEFGSAEHFTDALADFQISIAELFTTLTAEEQRLGPDLRATLQQLRRYIASTTPT